MTTIRPNMPSPLPAGAPTSAAASARAAFFQAMNGVAPAAPVTPAAPVQKAADTAAASAREAAQAAAPRPDPARSLRPGSLLDIRV